MRVFILVSWSGIFTKLASQAHAPVPFYRSQKLYLPNEKKIPKVVMHSLYYKLI